MTTINNASASVETVEISLADIRDIKELFPQLTENATRAIKPATVNQYALGDLSKFPPVKVVETDKGFGLIDGNHRYQAHVRQVTLKHLNVFTENSTEREQQTALDKMLPAQHEEIQKLLETAVIDAVIGVYDDVAAVNKACLTENLKNGMPPASKARVTMALEYYLLTRDDNPSPKQVEIARLFEIAPPTLNEYIKKYEKAQAVAAQAEETEEGVQAPDTTEAKSPEELEAEKALQKAEKFLKWFDGLYEVDAVTYNAIATKMFATSFVALGDMNAESDIEVYADNIRASLGVAKDTTELAFYMKFYQGMGQWFKNASANAKRKTTKKAETN